ncbi:hypothetical protein RS030_71083 [Cryptosporidium xiaoi]|uniref:Uncharacterized protein n=1 Tax=Cryptosporidium xiaoi TaxID=659607 RepID=A0AAV9XTL1_9CRYT
MIGNIVDFDRKESYVFWEEDGQNKVPTTPSTLSPSSLHGVGSPLLSENKIGGSDSQYCKTLGVGNIKRSENDILSDDIGCLSENSIGILGWSRNLIQDAVQQESGESEFFVYPYHTNNAEDMFREEQKLDTNVLIISDMSPNRKIDETDTELNSITESRGRCNLGNSGHTHNTHCNNGIIMTTNTGENVTNTHLHVQHNNSNNNISNSGNSGTNSGNDHQHHHHGGNIDNDTLSMLYSRIPGFNINNSENSQQHTCGYTNINSNANISDNANINGSNYNMVNSIFKEICSEENSKNNHKDLSRYMDDDYLETLKTNLILEFTKSRTCYLKLVPSVIEVFRIVRDIPSRCPVPIVQTIDDLGKEENIEKFENYFNNCITKQNCGFLAFCTEKRALKSGGGGKYYFFDRKLQLNGCHKVDVLNHHRQKNILGPVFMKVLLFMFVVDPPYHLDPRARSSNPQRLMDFYYQLKSMNKLGSIKRLLKVWCMEMCPEVYLDVGYPLGSLLWVSTLDIESHIKKWRYRGKKSNEQNNNINPLVNINGRLDSNGMVNDSRDEILEKKLVLNTDGPASNVNLVIRDKNNNFSQNKNDVSISRLDSDQINSNENKKDVISPLNEPLSTINSAVQNSTGIEVSLQLSQNQGLKKDVALGSKNNSICQLSKGIINNLGQETLLGSNGKSTDDCKKANSSFGNNLFVQKKTRGRGRPPRIKQKEGKITINNLEYDYLRKGETAMDNMCFGKSALEISQKVNSDKKLENNDLSRESIIELELEFEQYSDFEYSSSRFIWDSIKSLPIEALNKLYISWLDGNIPGVTRLFVNSSPALHSYLSMESNYEKKLASYESGLYAMEGDIKECQVGCSIPTQKRRREEDQMSENDKTQEKPQPNQAQTEIGNLSATRRAVLYYKALYLVIQKHLLIHSSEFEALLRALQKNKLKDENGALYSSEIEKMGYIHETTLLQTKNINNLSSPIQYLNDKASSCNSIKSKFKDPIVLRNSNIIVDRDIRIEKETHGNRTLKLDKGMILENEILVGKCEKNTSKENLGLEIGESECYSNKKGRQIRTPNQNEILTYRNSNQLSIEGLQESQQNEFEDETREEDMQEVSSIFSIISSSQYQNYFGLSDISNSITGQLLCDQNELSKHYNGGSINEPIDFFFAIT